MEHKFIFNEDELEWRCACGNPVVELDFKMIYYHNLEMHNNTKRQFQITDWDITSSLHCKCGNLYVSPDDYELEYNDVCFVGIKLLDIDGGVGKS